MALLFSPSPAPLPRVAIALPWGEDGICLLDLRADLAACVGFYARVPEFARDGPLLRVALGAQDDCGP